MLNQYSESHAKIHEILIGNYIGFISKTLALEFFQSLLDN